MAKTKPERDALIDRYAAGYDEVAAALEGITEAGWLATEGPGEWNPRQVVHHLADSEMMSAMRIRLLAAEGTPIIQGYDQEQFAQVLFYDRPVEGSLLAFRGAREATVPLLRMMTEAQWAAVGNHTEYGAFPADTWLDYYANHAHDHADQIRRARATVER